MPLMRLCRPAPSKGVRSAPWREDVRAPANEVENAAFTRAELAVIASPQLQGRP
jgi:hypothetical protein